MADFDPDAYLREKGFGSSDFNPDAYLANLDRRGHPYDPRFAPEPGRQINNTGPYDALQAGIQQDKARIEDRFKKSRSGSILAGVNAVKNVGGDIYQTRGKALLDPQKRRQLERGVSDVVTLGYGQQIADAAAAHPGIAAALVPAAAPTLLEGKLAEKLGGGEQRTLAELEPGDQQAAPEYRTTGNAFGMAMPGIPSVAGKLGAGVAGKYLAGVPAKGAIPGAMLGAAKSIAGYEATAPLLAAAQAGQEDRLGALKDAASDPVGLGMAGTLGAVAGSGRGYAEKLRDPKTLSGRVLRDVEAAGGEIKPFGKPVQGGLYESPELTNLPEGRAGVNELASNTEARLKEHGREKLAQARADYHDQGQAILAEHQGQPHPANATQAVLDDMAKRATLSSGKVADKKLHGFVDEMRDLLSTETDKPDMAHLRQTGDVRMLQQQAVPVEDLIKIKQLANDAAEWGSPATRDNAPYRLIYHALGEDAAAVDPRIGQLNQQYGQTMKELEEANAILYGKRKPDVADSFAKSKSAALKLGRVGDETQAATTDAPQLARLAQVDPVYAESLQALEAKKAMERLRYGEPEVSTSFEKGHAQSAKKIAHRVIGAGIGALLGHGTIGHAVGGAVGAGTAGTLDNPLALKLRLGLPAAESLGSKTGVPTTVKLNALTDAMARQKKREQEAAQRLTGQ